MTKHTYLALLCAVAMLGLLMPPVLAVETAPGASYEYVLPGGQEHPDVDGNMVVWEYSLLGGQKDIYCMSTSITGLRPLTDDPASQERPSISGDYVVWQDNRSGNWDIYLYSFSTNETTQLTNDTSDQWLPVINGNYVVWYDNREGSTDICLYDIGAGTELALIDCNPELGTDTTKFKPAVSDEYVAWEETGDGIWLYEIATGARWAVSPSTADQSWPSIIGDLIAWEDYRWGASWQSAIYLKNLSTNEELQLTTQSNEQVSPTLSESIIAWEDKRDGQWNVYMYDLQDLPDGEEMAVPTTGGEQLYPAVSGNTIVWQKNRGEFANICVYTYVPGESTYNVTRIEVEPSTATLEIGGGIKFNATCYDQNNSTISDLKVTWSCSNTTVGYIDPGGYFDALAAGTATITASTAGVSAQAIVTVNATNATEQVLKTIEIEPSAATVAVGDSEAFTAVCYDQNDSVMTGVAVVWASGNETVGTVSENGTFTALAEGTTNVTASAENVTGTADVTVTASTSPVLTTIEVSPATASVTINDTVTFSATALDQSGTELPGTAVTWASSNETVGTVDENGTFTALAEGTTNVTASAEDVTGTATVTVSNEEPVLTGIEVAPAATTLEVNDTQVFTAAGYDQFGSTMTDVAVAWASGNETVGTIDADGMFTALAEGTTTVTASAENVTGIANVTVTAGTPIVTSITVAPPVVTLEIDDLQQFTAAVLDQFGAELPGITVTWTSSNETVGTIDTNGTFVALAAGTANVTASAENVTGTADVTVVAKESTLGKIVVSPSAVTLGIDDTRQFDAIVFDRFGATVTDAEVAWTSSDETVGTIDANGTFVALAAGTATVTASAENVTGTAEITIPTGEPVLTSISIAPPAITLAVGDSEVFAATCYDQNGYVIPDVEVTWVCSDETVGTIDTDGTFAALAAGTASVTASAENVTGTADVTVTDQSSGVVVSPSAITLDVGDSRQFAATVYDTEGNITPGVVVTWSCDDETVGTIGTDGLFVALSEGTATITASAENATGTATVTIRPEFSALARIAISPSDFTIAAGNGMTLAATAFDRDGNTVPDTGMTWTSSNETVGTIGADGAFAALSEGTTTITASADGISGTAYVTVEPALPVPTGIELASDTVALKTGETWTFTATVIDQYGNEMDWVRVTWSCPDTSVGVADRTGLFRALAEGTTSVVASVGSLEKTVAVTIAAASTSTSTGGGDSGGGSSGPTFDAGTHQNMKSGETFTFSEMTTSSIDSVSVTAAGTIPNLMLTVKKAVAPSAGGPSAGDVYEYVEIALNWADPKNISNATVVFTIPTAWLDEHGMAPEDVVLMRYVDGAWQTLETEVVGEENGYYRFRATTPGFSTFAIAAVSVNETTPVETVATTAEETNVTVNETGNATVETTTEPTTETTTVPATTPTTPLVYAPFLAPLAFLLWARRKN